MNDPLYNHVVFGPSKGKGGNIGKSDDQLIQDLIAIHNAENWLGMDGDSELSMFNGKEGHASDRKKPTHDSNGVLIESEDKSRAEIIEPKGIKTVTTLENCFVILSL